MAEGARQSEVTGAPSLFGNVLDWVGKIGVPAAIAFVLLFLTNQKLDRIAALQEKTVILLEAHFGGNPK